MITGLQHQKMAVQSGYWPLFRYNPDLVKEGKNPMQLDYAGPRIPLKDFTELENRFKMLTKSNPEVAQALGKLAQDDVNEHWQVLQNLAGTKQE
jgi:pyruvate-ferredoxin/flavodoxin oxidoreductase